VLRDKFDHQSHVYAEEIAELAEIRGIALSTARIELALERASNRVLRKQFDFPEDSDDRIAYKISEKGVQDLRQRYAGSGPRVLLLDGSTPWTDRHLTLPEIAAELQGRICIVDKFYGSGSLAILNHFRHGSPLQFLTARTNESRASFDRELRDFVKEVSSVEVRRYPNHHELHDRYIISNEALVIVGHGIKDMGSKQSFLVVLKGDTTRDLRTTLMEQFDARWAASSAL
jgi:hypothetical protein